jgi:putative membrane protein
MKRILRLYAIDTFSLWVTTQVAAGMVFTGGNKTFFITGAAVMAVSLIARPVINMLLLPLNLVTFGLFRWVSSAVIFYLVTLLIKDFRLEHFRFEEFNNTWFYIPSFYFEGIIAFIGFGFIYSIVTSVIYWLTKH